MPRKETSIMNIAQPADRALAHIRCLVASDMPAVLAIEADSHAYAWLVTDFADALRIENVRGAVAEHEGKIVGYMIFELHSTGIDLFRLAVAKDFRGMGV